MGTGDTDSYCLHCKHVTDWASLPILSPTSKCSPSVPSPSSRWLRLFVPLSFLAHEIWVPAQLSSLETSFCPGNLAMLSVSQLRLVATFTEALVPTAYLKSHPSLHRLPTKREKEPSLAITAGPLSVTATFPTGLSFLRGHLKPNFSMCFHTSSLKGVWKIGAHWQRRWTCVIPPPTFCVVPTGVNFLLGIFSIHLFIGFPNVTLAIHMCL